MQHMIVLPMFENTSLHKILSYLFPSYLAGVAMQSRESKLGLLLEDAQTVLEQGVKSGAVKMDMQLEIRYFVGENIYDF